MNPSDSQPDAAPTLLISGEGIILDAHDAMCAALGWTREALVNKTVGELFEYGADLVLIRMQGVQTGSSTESEFTVSALIRRQDQTNFPTTAIVRHIAELDCFSLGFDDVAVEAGGGNETNEVAAAAEASFVNEAAVSASVEETEPVESTLESLDIVGAMRVSAPEPEPTPVRQVHQPAPAAPTHKNGNGNGNGSENGNGNGNGNGSNGGNTTFRNIFLSTGQRPPANGKNEMAAQLESERQERKRLEARVLSLTEQLKQLHVQLQHNLESESIFQKRVNECEEAVRLAEQGKAEAEAAIGEKEKEREQVEVEFAEFKAAQERFEEERKCAQQEWLVKLEANLIALKESDARVAKELEARRSIQATLQGLKEDFRVQVGRALEFHHEPVKPAAKPAAEVESQPA